MSFYDECSIQQFVPRHMHIRRPLGKRYNKKYAVTTVKTPPIQFGVPCCAVVLFT